MPRIQALACAGLIACGAFGRDDAPAAPQSSSDDAGASPPDAGDDDGGVRLESGDAESGPCATDTLLAGFQAPVTATVGYATVSGNMDAYGFVPAADSVARCVRVHIAEGESGAPIIIGVYSSEDESAPNVLVASATLTNATPGIWNTAPLSAPVTLEQTHRVWIGVGALNGRVQLRHGKDNHCPSALYRQSVPLDAEMPPSPYSKTPIVTMACDLLAYLSP